MVRTTAKRGIRVAAAALARVTFAVSLTATVATKAPYGMATSGAKGIQSARPIPLA